MLAAQDSFLKFLAVGLTGSGIPVTSAPDKPLTLNALNVLFLSTVPALRVNPVRFEMIVSLDLLVSGDSANSAERKAKKLIRVVDEALAAQTATKQDFEAVPPSGMGSALYWQLGNGWRRIPDPDSLYEHWSCTMSVWFTENKRI